MEIKNEESVELLKEHGATASRRIEMGRRHRAADINDELIYAAMYGNLERVKLLLDRGADINAKDEYGDTALMQAAVKGYIDIVKLLLDAGVDISTEDVRGRTALMWAEKNAYPEIVELLKQYGATASRRTADINDELRIAVRDGNLEKVKELLDRGADVNTQDNNGYTVLMKAVYYYNYTDIVKLLLDRGANVNVKANNGETALMIAEEHEYVNIVQQLKQYREKN